MEPERKRPAVEAEQKSSSSRQSNSQDESGCESSGEKDCFHCRLAGPGQLCSYCRFKAGQDSVAQTGAQQIRPGGSEAAAAVKSGAVYEQVSPAGGLAAHTGAAGRENAQAEQKSGSFTYRYKSLFDGSGGDSHSKESDKRDCFQCRLAGPGKSCSYCRMKVEQRLQAETSADINPEHEWEQKRDTGFGQSSQAIEAEQKRKSFESEQLDQAIEAEQQRQSFESEQLRQALESEQLRLVREAEQLGLVLEAEQLRLALEAEQKLKVLEADQKRLAMEAEQKLKTIEAEKLRRQVEADQGLLEMQPGQRPQARRVQEKHPANETEQNRQAVEIRQADLLAESESKSCPLCGNQIRMNALFCKFCHGAIQHTASADAEGANSRAQAYVHVNADPEVADAEAKLKDAEARYGPNDIMVAKYLGAYASLLNSKGIRPADVAAMDAREKAIRAGYTRDYENRICPRCRRANLKQTTKCRYCDFDTASENQAVSVNYEASYTVSSDRIQGDPEHAIDPLICAVLSGCFITGAGQMILGQFRKGLTILIGAIILGFMTNGASWFLILPASAFDAYRNAEKLKKGKNIGKWEWF